MFKIGDKVRVCKKVEHWSFPKGGGCIWSSELMDETIGKVYIIIDIDKAIGYQLDTNISPDYWMGDVIDCWYPVEAICLAKKLGQLEFPFMGD